MAKEITDGNFDETVLKSNQVALLDFWAQWCGPCRAIAPIIEDLYNLIPIKRLQCSTISAAFLLSSSSKMVK